MKHISKYEYAALIDQRYLTRKEYAIFCVLWVLGWTGLIHLFLYHLK